MLMLINQFQFTNITDEELKLIPDFCEFLCQHMFAKLDNKINRRKIQLRLNYLSTVPWIQWIKDPIIGTSEILKAIEKSFNYEEGNYNIWKIKTNSKIYIPNSVTPIDRLIRFLDFGDLKCHGTGMFTKLKEEYSASKLTTLWQLYIMNNLGYISHVKIITD